MPSVALVALGELPCQEFVDGPGSKDQQVVARRQPVRDLQDKALQVFEAVRLAGGLRSPAAAVTDARIVADASGSSVVSRHLRFHSCESSAVSLRADDDGLPSVDPD
ncbi:MAG: hypothetical protein WD830_08355 [Chloroflexota bacterium]